EFEHDRLELPRADLVLYLDMPTDFAVKLLRSREQSTNTTADIHEVDDAYLASCRAAALQAAQVLGWTVIPCVKDGALRSIEDIHDQIWSLVAPLL
ncbi:MAG: thymidylate kinase, partial [Oscillospiraceae bacterium]|nr:thymidylate kinase [Oscillospiraceae bacterium]